MTNEQIKLRNFFKQLQAMPCIEKIVLYGSRARGDNKERSDIDLAIVCPQASKKDTTPLKQSILQDEIIFMNRENNESVST